MIEKIRNRDSYFTLCSSNHNNEEALTVWEKKSRYKFNMMGIAEHRDLDGVYPMNTKLDRR
jgi:hypothetical protein